MTFDEYKRWLCLVLQAVHETATPETAEFSAGAAYVLFRAIEKAGQVKA